MVREAELRMRATAQLLGYYITLLLFGAGGLVLTVFCFLTGWVPATGKSERFFQRLIHLLLAAFVWWVRFIRLMHVTYHGFARLPSGGCVLVANHPGLMDITYLLARLPEAVCVFKPAIRRNPILGASARRAGYIAGDGGHDAIRRAAAKVAAGNILVIFPEGTRTRGGERVGACKPGFVLVARRAAAPIQLVRITWNSNVLAKGQPWWKLPRLPAFIDVTIGPRLAMTEETDTAAVTAEIEGWFQADPETAACQLWPAGVTVLSSSA